MKHFSYKDQINLEFRMETLFEVYFESLKETIIRDN